MVLNNEIRQLEQHIGKTLLAKKGITNRINTNSVCDLIPKIKPNSIFGNAKRFYYIL